MGWPSALTSLFRLSTDLCLDPICARQEPSGEAAGGERRLAGDGPKGESVRGFVSSLQFLLADR